MDLARAADAQRIAGRLCHIDAGLLQLGHERFQMFGDATGDRKIAAGNGAREQERAGLDAIGDDGVIGPVEPLDALDADFGSARAFDLRAHGGEQARQIGHLRLARGVAQYGFALGEDGGHHQVFRSSDGDALEVDHSAAQAMERFRFDIAVGLIDSGAQPLQTEDVQIDGPRADGASARHGDARAAGARHQRTQNQAGGAHGLDQFIWRFGADDSGGMHANGLAILIHLRSDIHQEPLHGADVADARNAAERHRLIGEQRRGQCGQRRILGAAGGNFAVEGSSAGDDKLIHGCLSGWRRGRCYRHRRAALRRAGRKLQQLGRRCGERGRVVWHCWAARSPSDCRRHTPGG